MKTFFPLALLSIPTLATAQIAILPTGATGSTQINLSDTYHQSFDDLSSTTGIMPWVQNSTIPGWFSNTSGIIFHSSLGLLSLGQSQGGGDRALGLQADSIFLKTFAVVFSNQTGLTLDSFSISFDGEQWAQGSNQYSITSELRFAYQIFPAGTDAINDRQQITTGWNYVPELTFYAQQIETHSRTLDGNLPENRVDDIHAFISGIAVPPDHEIWLRWSSGHTPYVQHALAIDDLRVSFTAIPEPATFTALAGLASLAYQLTRRRRRFASF